MSELPQRLAQQVVSPGFQSPQQRSRYKFQRIDELAEAPKRTEVVEGLLAAGEIAALAGAPGSGKSAIAQRLVNCVAEGKPFFRRDVRAGLVIYVAAERFLDTSRRLFAHCRGPSPLYLTKDRPKLSRADDVRSLASEVTALSNDIGILPALVVFDTFARCVSESDENSSREMGPVIDNLTMLCDMVPTAAVVFVHHTDKKGESMRGSGALQGGVDLELTVSRGKENIRKVTVTKANAVTEDQSFLFRLAPVELSPNETVISIVEVNDDEDTGLVLEIGPSREERVLHIIQDLTIEGRADRRACFERVRAEGIIVGRTKESTSEQFRRVLKKLRDARQITFDNKNIWLGCPG